MGWLWNDRRTEPVNVEAPVVGQWVNHAFGAGCPVGQFAMVEVMIGGLFSLPKMARDVDWKRVSRYKLIKDEYGHGWVEWKPNDEELMPAPVGTVLDILRDDWQMDTVFVEEVNWKSYANRRITHYRLLSKEEASKWVLLTQELLEQLRSCAVETFTAVSEYGRYEYTISELALRLEGGIKMHIHLPDNISTEPKPERAIVLD